MRVMADALHEHAAESLRFIRDTMERAGSFTSIPGWGGFAIGLTAIGASVAAQPLRGRAWLAVWIGEAALAAVIGAVTVAMKGRRAGTSFTTPAAKRFFAGYLAPMLAGAILTIALYRAGAFAAMPATWLLLYGTAFVSRGAVSIRGNPGMGVCYMLLGGARAFAPLPPARARTAAGEYPALRSPHRREDAPRYRQRAGGEPVAELQRAQGDPQDDGRQRERPRAQARGRRVPDLPEVVRGTHAAHGVHADGGGTTGAGEVFGAYGGADSEHQGAVSRAQGAGGVLAGARASARQSPAT